MIDTITSIELHNTESPQRDDLGEASMEDETPPEGPFLFLLLDDIQGFGLHVKKWRMLIHLVGLRAE
jgi:hypothetical protein